MRKIVLIESIRRDYPFQIRFYERETDKVIFITRPGHDPEIDDPEKVNKSNVIGIFSESRYEEFVEIQHKQSEMYWAVQNYENEVISRLKEEYKNV